MLTRAFLFLFLAWHCGAYGAVQVYENYEFDGRVQNAAAGGAAPVTSENLTFVPLGPSRQAGRNFQKDPDQVSALPDVKSQLPSGLSSLRVSAWIRTTDGTGRSER